ncbi:MAG: DUF962 domain-containing protein [Moraxellaceae bacterium]|nr:DUF962 domain-containing protein [Moraxellaceae bacterium]MDP1775802.1 DUF962 domain-containing protein [Moraxellaceae bacterium]
MKTLTDHLSQYALYHRDQRNIWTHLVGVPMIVLSLAALLARPSIDVAGFPLSAATVVLLVSALFYLRLELMFGLIMSVLMAATLVFAQWAASLSTMYWLIFGLGGFVVGWIIQFVGHYYEGKKPAFVDDLSGLAIGPLFVTAEIVFMLGLRNELMHEIEQRSGKVKG